MTEEEAKTKWCPFARLTLAREVGDAAEVLAGETVFNRAHDQKTGAMFTPEGALCIGSACMAWQWTITGGYQSETRGFCGLAGAPL